MQDIKRSELLDKLASGWSVRVKSRDGLNKLCNITELQGISMRALIDAEWEGEPPMPKMRHAHCSILFACTELAGHGCAFIRRPNWVHGTELCAPMGHYTLSAEDILSNDWEVWA
jgi:hypothetical protein